MLSPPDVASVPAPAPDAPRPPLPPQRPRRWVTALLTVLLCAALAGILASPGEVGPLEAFDRPLEVVLRYFDRALVQAEAPGAWLDGALALSTPRPEVEAEALEQLRAALAAVEAGRLEADPPLVRALRAYLAVVRAETGSWDDAEALLSGGAGAPLAGPFADALRFAYGRAPGAPPPLAPALEVLAPVPELEGSWAAARLAQRALERAGQREAAGRQEAQLSARARALRVRARLSAALWLVPGLAGAALGAALLRRRRALPQLSWGLRAAPWSPGLAFAVVVRGAALGAVLAIALWQLPGPLAAWSTLLGAALPMLPMLALARRWLLAPAGLRLGATFGLTPVGDMRALAQVTLVLVGLEVCLGMGLPLVAEALGLDLSWTDLASEALMLGTAGAVAGYAVAAVVVAAVLEELGFRGFLYVSLRTRLGVLPAAVLTAALFAGIHLYSLPAAVSLFAAALASSLVYERTGSLWPCILAHGFHNLVAVSAGLLVLR